MSRIFCGTEHIETSGYHKRTPRTYCTMVLASLHDDPSGELLLGKFGSWVWTSVFESDTLGAPSSCRYLRAMVFLRDMTDVGFSGRVKIVTANEFDPREKWHASAPRYLDRKLRQVCLILSKW